VADYIVETPNRMDYYTNNPRPYRGSRYLNSRKWAKHLIRARA
jgi:hypothetical protein